MRISRLELMMVVIGLIAALMACKKFGKKSEESAVGDATGIAECDEYLTKYEKCVKDKVPTVARAALERGLKQQRDGWKQAAQNSSTKATLAATCKQALDATKTAMGSYGCEW